jgi:hypothetical protein
MGSENGFDNERPAHRVWLDAFLIGLYPVTNGEYRRFVEETGALQPPFWSEAMFCDLEKPVVGITWDEARRYCDWLSGATGKPFRLPTEAEWECAARGGLEQNTYPWGDEHPLERPYPGCDVENGGPARVTHPITTRRRKGTRRAPLPGNEGSHAGAPGVTASNSAGARLAAPWTHLSDTRTMASAWPCLMDHPRVGTGQKMNLAKRRRDAEFDRKRDRDNRGRVSSATLRLGGRIETGIPTG